MIQLYPRGQTDFSAHGITLHPSACTVNFVGGGRYDVDLVLPLHLEGEMSREVALIDYGMMLDCPVPPHTIPQISMGLVSYWRIPAGSASVPLYKSIGYYKKAVYANWEPLRSYMAGDLVTYNGANFRCTTGHGGISTAPPENPSLWAQASPTVYVSGTVITQLPAGTQLLKSADLNAAYMRVFTLGGLQGYVEKSKCESVGGEEEYIIPARTITRQAFRITEIVKDEKAGTMTVHADHASYALADVLLSGCVLNNATPQTALSFIVGAMQAEYRGQVITNINGDPVSGDFSWKNALSAIIDPKSGLCSMVDGYLVRDDWDVFILANSQDGAPTYSVAYGVNMVGVKWRGDTSAMVSRVYPIAQAEDGSELLLPEKFIDSPRSVPFTRMELLKIGARVGAKEEQTDGTTITLTEADVFSRMRAAANARFSVDRADAPSVSLELDFVRMGDTEEYAQYKALRSMAPYEWTKVRNGPLGIDTAVQLTGYQWDAILLRYNKASFGAQSIGGSVASYQLSAGSVTGRVLALGSVDGSAISPGTITARNMEAHSITAEQLAARVITTELLASNAITAEELSAGSVTTEKLQALAVTAGKIAAGAVETEKLAAGAVTAQKIAAGAIQAVHLSTGVLEAVDARIETASIGYAQIKDASVQNLIARDAVTDRYFIDKLQVRNVQAVQATVGDLVIKASNGNYYRLNVNANGSLTPTQVTPTAAEIASGETSDGHGAIIETDLTVADLSASNLKAINALIDKITASRIDVGELFARSATISQLNAADISGNQSLRLMVQSRSKNYTQWAQPTGTAAQPLAEGDIWDQNSGIRTWAELGELTWEEASAYPWWAFTGGKQYVYRSGAWQLMTDEVSLRETQTQILLEQDSIRLSVAEKYGIQSGIDILAAGIEISGGKYVKIKSGGLFTVESGNFSIDENGNVTMTGTVNAGAGSVLGGWTLGANRLSSGSGAGYVALDSDASGTYALWAGNAAAAQAPFRVTRAGKVYLTSLATVDEQGNETIINLSNRNSAYPLWKLNYSTVKNISVANNTLTIETTGGTVNFSKAVRVATSAGDIDVGSLGPDPGGIPEHVTIYYDDGQHTANVPIVVAGTQTLYSRGAASVGVRSWSVDKSDMPTVTVTVTLTNGEVRSYSFNV